MAEGYIVVKRTKSERRNRRAIGLRELREKNRQIELHAKGDAESQGPRPPRHYPTRKWKRGHPIEFVIDTNKIISDGSESGTSFKQALFFKEIGFNLETMIYSDADREKKDVR